MPASQRKEQQNQPQRGGLSRAGLACAPSRLLYCFSLVEPDRPQILIDVMTGTDLPAFDIRAVRHDPLPPQQVDRMNLLVEDVFVEFEQVALLLGLVEFAQLPVV